LRYELYAQRDALRRFNQIRKELDLSQWPVAWRSFQNVLATLRKNPWIGKQPEARFTPNWWRLANDSDLVSICYRIDVVHTAGTPGRVTITDFNLHRDP
jgi:plasmid stabilization system protein ParE